MTDHGCCSGFTIICRVGCWLGGSVLQGGRKAVQQNAVPFWVVLIHHYLTIPHERTDVCDFNSCISPRR